MKFKTNWRKGHFKEPCVSPSWIRPTNLPRNTIIPPNKQYWVPTALDWLYCPVVANQVTYKQKEWEGTKIPNMQKSEIFIKTYRLYMKSRQNSWENWASSRIKEVSRYSFQWNKSHLINPSPLNPHWSNLYCPHSAVQLRHKQERDSHQFSMLKGVTQNTQ